MILSIKKTLNREQKRKKYFESKRVEKTILKLEFEFNKYLFDEDDEYDYIELYNWALINFKNIIKFYKDKLTFISIDENYFIDFYKPIEKS